MKSICLVNGSLRGKGAASLSFLQDVNRKLSEKEYHKTFIKVRSKVKDDYPEDTLKSLAGADVIIFVFPLYTYGLPGLSCGFWKIITRISRPTRSITSTPKST